MAHEVLLPNPNTTLSPSTALSPTTTTITPPSPPSPTTSFSNASLGFLLPLFPLSRSSAAAGLAFYPPLPSTTSAAATPLFTTLFLFSLLPILVSSLPLSASVMPTLGELPLFPPATAARAFECRCRTRGYPRLAGGFTLSEGERWYVTMPGLVR
ncbi:hypothetical protein AAG906_006147 [Vitis piasezkii]